jgi:branched-chain amino acid transport system substrate-binding protein
MKKLDSSGALTPHDNQGPTRGRNSGESDMTSLLHPTRRGLLLAGGAGLLTAALPGHVAAQGAPIKIGFQLHRTGIGAAYGRWYERTAQAALKAINDGGGIAGRPVELLFEDDATDPKRGAEVVDKLTQSDGCDVVMGTLFSHVVMGSAPRAGELKVPYLVCSEGYHVASGALNRWTLQPGITDVRSQIQAMAPWVSANLGKKVAMVFPDYAFGYDHRDFFTAAIAAQGGEVVAQIAIPPTETTFTRYFPQIPAGTEVIYHVMVGPAVLTFVKELGEFYGSGAKPQLFGFIDSLEAVDTATPGLEFLEGSHFWEAHPRVKPADAGEHEAAYRAAVGVDDNGASVSDPADVATYSHMFSTWETLFFLKQAMEAAGYTGPADRQKLVEAMEAIGDLPYGIERPQGAKVFNGKTHQVFGTQNISQIQGGKLVRVHQTSMADGAYDDAVDYTTMAF